MKKLVIFFAISILLVGIMSCKKDKCQYYNDIMTYYDQSEEAWYQRYEQGLIDTVVSFDTTDLQNQLYKIELERSNLQKQYKDCVNK